MGKVERLKRAGLLSLSGPRDKTFECGLRDRGFMKHHRLPAGVQCNVDLFAKRLGELGRRGRLVFCQDRRSHGAE